MHASRQLIFALALIAAPALVRAQDAAAGKPAPDPEARAALRAAFLTKTGGILQTPATGPALLFLNTQAETAEAELRAVTDAISRLTRLSVTFASKASADPLAEAAGALASTNVAAVVVIADLPGQPSLLIAPENRWALVNAAPLGGAGVSDELRDERVRKQVWRAFGYLMGAAHSNFQTCLLKSVLSTDDLDALKMQTLSPEPFGKILSHARTLGMEPMRFSTYRKAVEEGWAPTPSNDVQKAIWKEVKQKAQPTP